MARGVRAFKCRFRVDGSGRAVQLNNSWHSVDLLHAATKQNGFSSGPNAAANHAGWDTYGLNVSCKKP